MIDHHAKSDLVAADVCEYGHSNVPEGYVGIRAIRDYPEEEKYFLIPETEYRGWQTNPPRGEMPFVIDESRHQLWNDDSVEKLNQLRWNQDDVIDYCPRCGARHWADSICPACGHVF